jgi:hypothetical protein
MVERRSKDLAAKLICARRGKRSQCQLLSHLGDIPIALIHLVPPTHLPFFFLLQVLLKFPPLLYKVLDCCPDRVISSLTACNKEWFCYAGSDRIWRVRAESLWKGKFINAVEYFRQDAQSGVITWRSAYNRSLIDSTRRYFLSEEELASMLFDFRFKQQVLLPYYQFLHRNSLRAKHFRPESSGQTLIQVGMAV